MDGVGFMWNLILSQSDVTDSLIDRRPVRERQWKVWGSKTFQYLTGVERPCKNELFIVTESSVAAVELCVLHVLFSLCSVSSLFLCFCVSCFLFFFVRSLTRSLWFRVYL